MVSLIEENLSRTSMFLLLGALFSLFGLMHSPYAHGALFLPWRIPDKTPLYLSLSYFILSALSLSVYYSERGSVKKVESRGLIPRKTKRVTEIKKEHVAAHPLWEQLDTLCRKSTAPIFCLFVGVVKK
ncbi:MAG: hypothetical protein C4291_01840 [Candidatus Dadabacteria bacterium]